MASQSPHSWTRDDLGTYIQPVEGTILVPSPVAESQKLPGLMVIYEVPIAAGALGNTDVVITHKFRVLNAWHILRGAGVPDTTLQVFNGPNAITDAMAASGSDKAVVRCTSINDAYYEIAEGGTLRVTSAAGATQPAALVLVQGVLVA